MIWGMIMENPIAEFRWFGEWWWNIPLKFRWFGEWWWKIPLRFGWSEGNYRPNFWTPPLVGLQAFHHSLRPFCFGKCWLRNLAIRFSSSRHPCGQKWLQRIWSSFPTCQVSVVRFYVRCTAPPSSSSFLAGPYLPALDRSEPRRISSASSW